MSQFVKFTGSGGYSDCANRRGLSHYFKYDMTPSFKNLVVAALCMAFGFAAPALSKPTTAKPVSAESSSVPQLGPASTQLLNPSQVRSLTMAAMGKPNGITLTGYANRTELNSGVRLDEAVTKATLRLKATYPPGMRHDQSFIRVYVNNQLAGMAQLKADKAGISHWMNIELEPALFTDFANVLVVYDGTYDAVCVAPENPTLRVDVSAESKLDIESRPLTLVNDLAMLPAPFFDPRDSNRLELPVVLPQQLSPTQLKAAGLVSSWLGAQASYRQARFEVKKSVPDNRHSVIFSTGELLPIGLKTSDLTGPMLWMDQSPSKPWIKQLYVLGRNDEELLTAAQGLVLESQVLSGQKAVIQKVDLGPARKAYDAPRYVPTHRPVRFAELMDYPGQLEASTGRPSVALNLRLPPDLFSWAGKNVDMALKYRVTSPSNWNDSLLTVDINDNLIQSFRLAPRAEPNQSRLTLNLLGAGDLNDQESLKIPAFRVGGNNTLKFSFNWASEGNKACAARSADARGAIDPNSTVDFSDLPHYIQMPDLAAFANGGYPFSIYADLSQTAVVLPAQPSTTDTQAYLNLLGLFGQWTGLPSLRVSVVQGFDAQALQNKHWIALGVRDQHPWLDDKGLNLPMVLTQVERSMGRNRLTGWFENLWQSENAGKDSANARAWVTPSGALGALLGFESNLNKGYGAVVLTGTDELSYQRMSDSLLDYDQVGRMRGSVALMRGGQVESYRVGSTYVAGSLPWWLRIRIAFSEYPVLVAVAGAAGGVLLAILMYGWLAGRANRRMKGQI